MAQLLQRIKLTVPKHKPFGTPRRFAQRQALQRFEILFRSSQIIRDLVRYAFNKKRRFLCKTGHHTRN